MGSRVDTSSARSRAGSRVEVVMVYVFVDVYPRAVALPATLLVRGISLVAASSRVDRGRALSAEY